MTRIAHSQSGVGIGGPSSIDHFSTTVGVSRGVKRFKIIDADEADEIIRDNDDRKQLISALLKACPRELWDELVVSAPDLANSLSALRIYNRRRETLRTFESALNKAQDEPWWQHFFENNQWIFGYGLNYVFLNQLQAQPHYGGSAVSGGGAQKGDYLTNTEGIRKFSVLVEIKKPTTPLLTHERYRNAAWPPSQELAGGISQLQSNCRTWETEGSESSANRDDLSAKNVFTIQPKGILVIGHLNQLRNRQQTVSFQLLRRNLHNPEVITFDELFERAKFILENEKPAGLKDS